MPEIIAPPKTLQVSFALEPAIQAVHSLALLNVAEQFSGLGEWVYRTAAALSPEQRRANRLVDALGVDFWLEQGSWPSFPAYLDDLAASDPVTLRDLELDRLLEHAQRALDGELPTPAQLLADRATYLALIKGIYSSAEKDDFYDLELYTEAHGLLTDPSAMHALVLRHLRTMWDQCLAPEWERSEPMLQESVAAFQALNFSGMSCAEIVRRVTGRDLEAECEKWQAEASRLVFIPSAHLGPYVATVVVKGVVKILFGARVPEGVTVSSPALSRSELLMRLSALADDTRLRILELLTGEEELGAQEIMTRLDLSQSAASRHLSQLAATGYLLVRRREGAKFYRLNRERLDDTCQALKKSLH